MSKYFIKVKQYYDMDIWNIKRVRNAVINNWITQDEFKEITGSKFESE